MKIEKLTKAQEKQLVQFREQMLRFGRSTEPSDRKATEEVITGFYDKIGKKKPMFFWFDGPFTGYVAIEIIRTHLKDALKEGSNLRSNLGSNLGSNLESNLWSNLESNLWSNLGSNLWSNLRSNLGSNLGSNLESNLWSNLGSNLESNLGGSYWGQHEIAWIAFYDFCKQIGVPYADNDYQLLSQWLKLSSSTGWWVPFENICFCFERHSVLKVNSEGRLHCENGPAMAFRDGYELYYLNGVAITKEYVTTDAEKLDPKIILKETNVEVRRELLRKIGVERFIQEAGAKELDNLKIKRLNTEYTLLSVDLSEDAKAQKYLKMLNPSIGIWHVEGVANECKTVMEAIHSRKPKKMQELPINDTDGSEWFQQGDVCIWNRNAKSVKSLPSLLT